jgi:indolepyruvate decarboxylase
MKRSRLSAWPKNRLFLAGVEPARYRTAGLVLQMAERMNIPIAGDLLSKSAIPENHPLYIGVYGGASYCGS